MTMLLESVRPYQRLDRFDKTVVDGQIKAFLAHIMKTYRKPTKTPSSLPTCVRRGNEAIAIAEPEPQNVTPEPEIDFLLETQSQKRTRKPRKPQDKAVGSPAAPFYDRTLKDRIVSFVTRQGPVTSADIGKHFDMHRQRTSVVIAEMQKQKRLFVVGYTKNPRGQLVKVLHTDSGFVYTPPAPPVAADTIIEEKRPARVLSPADIERGRALVARNFSRDSIGVRAFELICLRPRSMPELEALFRCGNSSIKTMMMRMESLGIVERVGQERNVTAGRIRILFGVVIAKDAQPAQRVPPSPETIERGRAQIMERRRKDGGCTLQAFDELCANGPLTRSDLTKRLGCHCTMIDVALRNLDMFGLVAVIGKAMGSETGKMGRLWDVK